MFTRVITSEVGDAADRGECCGFGPFRQYDGPRQGTDDLIDERMSAIEEKLDRQFDELRAFRAELRAQMRTDSSTLRSEIAEVRRDLSAFQRQVTLIVAAFAVGLLGLLGAGQL